MAVLTCKRPPASQNPAIVRRSEAPRPGAPRFPITDWRRGGERWTPVLARCARPPLSSCAPHVIIIPFTPTSGAPPQCGRRPGLVQSLFASQIGANRAATANTAKGRVFRSFLLLCLKTVRGCPGAEGKCPKESTVGGRSVNFSVDDQEAAQRYALESRRISTQEAVYDRRWGHHAARASLGPAPQRVPSRGRLPLFEHLKAVQNDEAQSQKHLAASLGMTESATKSVLPSVLGSRYREVLREEVAQTVTGGKDVDEEIRYFAPGREPLSLVLTCWAGTKDDQGRVAPSSQPSLPIHK